MNIADCRLDTETGTKLIQWRINIQMWTQFINCKSLHTLLTTPKNAPALDGSTLLHFYLRDHCAHLRFRFAPDLAASFLFSTLSTNAFVWSIFFWNAKVELWPSPRVPTFPSQQTIASATKNFLYSSPENNTLRKSGLEEY